MNQTEILSMEEAKDWHVVGLVVQGNPKKIPAIRTALLAIPHTEVPTFDEKIGNFRTNFGNLIPIFFRFF